MKRGIVVILAGSVLTVAALTGCASVSAHTPSPAAATTPGSGRPTAAHQLPACDAAANAPPLRVSLLDRLLHHANVVVTDGDSYRMREARAKGGTTLAKT